MKKLLLTLSLCWLSYAHLAEAAPTRTSTSTGLFLAYDQPQDGNEGYSDKFYITAASDDQTYTVTYETDDSVIAVALAGGHITNFVRTETTAAITFRSTFSGTGSSDAVYLDLFTSARMNMALNEAGLKESLAGAHFSSELGRVKSRPVFFDEGYIKGEGANRLSVTTQYAANKTESDLLYAFFPSAALAYINNNSIPSASKVVVRQYSGIGFEASLGVRVDSETANGVLFRIPVTYGARATSVVADFSVVSATTLFAPTTTLASKSKIGLSAYIKDCTNSSRVTLESKRSGSKKYVVEGRKRLVNCAAHFTVTPKSTTTYRFKSGGVTYEKKVKVK